MLAAEPHGDGTDGVEACSAEGARFVNEHLGHRARVVHGLGVGHRADVDESARRRSLERAANVLFVFLAGLAHVGVQVDEPWQKPKPGAVDDRDVLGVDEVAPGVSPDAGDRSGLHEHVDDGVKTRVRIEGADVANEKSAHGGRAPNAPRAR